MKKKYESSEEEYEGMVCEPLSMGYSATIPQSKRTFYNRDKFSEKVNQARIVNVLDSEEEYARTGYSISLEEVIAKSHQKHPWLR